MRPRGALVFRVMLEVDAVLQVSQKESFKALYHHLGWATGQKSQRDLLTDCFGTGMMVTDLRRMGMDACSTETLNRSVCVSPK